MIVMVDKRNLMINLIIRLLVNLYLPAFVSGCVWKQINAHLSKSADRLQVYGNEREEDILFRSGVVLPSFAFISRR